MAMCGARKRAFASSKFSRRTRETYSGSKPAIEHPPLRVVGGRTDFEPPPLGRFGAERHGNAQELLPARDQERHLVAGLVLLEAVLETIRAHAELVDGENLVVNVEAAGVGWRVALHRRDEEAAVVVSGADAEPWP